MQITVKAIGRMVPGGRFKYFRDDITKNPIKGGKQMSIWHRLKIGETLAVDMDAFLDDPDLKRKHEIPQDEEGKIKLFFYLNPGLVAAKKNQEMETKIEQQEPKKIRQGE